MFARYYEFSKRVAHDFAEHGCTHMAGAISYYALVSLVPLGIVLMDAQGNPVFYNPKCQELHGMTLDTAKRVGWAHAVHPDDRGRVAGSWRAAAREGSALHVPVSHFRGGIAPHRTSERAPTARCTAATTSRSVLWTPVPRLNTPPRASERASKPSRASRTSSTWTKSRAVSGDTIWRGSPARARRMRVGTRRDGSSHGP